MLTGVGKLSSPLSSPRPKKKAETNGSEETSIRDRNICLGATSTLHYSLLNTWESCISSNGFSLPSKTSSMSSTLIIPNTQNLRRRDKSTWRAWCPLHAPTSLLGKPGCLVSERVCVPLPQKVSKIKITPKSPHSAWKHSAEAQTMIIGRHNSSSHQP